ncbi:MAG: phage portal protein, partial [Phycisphaeraceae bacterium]|nr:phage portal protein [Phycisphaeraceae bacterium]
RLRHHAADTPPREQVIENDIAWRIGAGIDFLLARPLTIQSCAGDPTLSDAIEALLGRTFDAAGGFRFFQDLALLGAVYGHVDALVQLDGRDVLVELIEPTRGIPLLNSDDYRKLDAYVVHYQQRTNDLESPSFLTRVRGRVLGGATMTARRTVVQRTRVFTDQSIAGYLGTHSLLGDPRTLVETQVNRLDRVPVVHIQNLPRPFVYQGQSDVEPLIGLQNELNTRLSDRANRVTFQSFKMYLGKGIEQFTERPVGPGQMWSTDNPDAAIQEFGGDAASPSEDAHIAEIREALDKTSGISPLAAGIIRGKVGNLTSENALRIVLMGLLARTSKKRSSYGRGIEELCELILQAADVAGLLHTEPEQRGVRIDWPDPLPANESQKLRDAQLKLELGVPRRQVLAELGYLDCAE